MSKIGFIILRHVNSRVTNENKILIIDDNSNYEYITDKQLYKTTIINSEFHQRGELLPYYYYLHNKLFDTAVIIHDSVFINTYIDFSVNKYKLLWDFQHFWDQIEDETKMIKLFNDVELLHFYQNKQLWTGCFGGMSIITHDYLVYLNNKYDIRKLLDVVLTRYNRCSFERVIACLLLKNAETKNVLLGNLHEYCNYWEINFKNKHNYKHLPIIKVWTGR